MADDRMIRAMSLFLEGMEWTMWGLHAYSTESPGRIEESAMVLARLAQSLKDLAESEEGMHRG